MKVDILVHVEDPGAVNFLKSLPEVLLGLGLNVVMICEGVAASIFHDHECFYPLNNETASRLLERLEPTLIIVGTSENLNSFGLILVKEAHNLGIYSVGMVDMFCNADNRFRGNSDDAFKYCPDELFLPDDGTKNQFLDLGAPAQKFTVVGNPAYKNALDFREKMEQSGLIRETGSLDKTRLRVLFVAEGWDKLNLDASRKNSNYSLHGRGGSDFRTIIAMEELVDSLARADMKCHITLRLHPNSEYADFMDIEKETFDKGMDNWIKMYQATGKSISKNNWLPAGFQPRIRQQRKDGLLIIYPWTRKYLDDGFNPDKDIYFGWQIIIPPTREEGDDKELYYDNAYNEAGYLARMEDYKKAFNPDLDS